MESTPALRVHAGKGERDARAEDLQAILRRRALALAVREASETNEETLEIVVLAVGEERYGIDVRHVREVHAPTAVTPVPRTSSWWLGVMNLRGSIHPVLDLAALLGLARGESPRAGTIALVSTEHATVGLLADGVLEMRRVPAASVASPAGQAGGRDGVAGMTPDLLSVIDLPALIDRASVSPSGHDAS
jgi:purine-binding chemotaxis protein CheW